MSTEGTVPERIAAATLELIAEQGLAGVGMSAVAERAGVARQTLYNHFPDIESIVTTVIEEHEEWGLAAISRLLEGQQGPASKLEQLIRHSVAMGAHRPELSSLENSLSARAQRELRAHRDRTEEIVKEVLAEGVAEGVFRSDLDLNLDASLIQALMMSAAGTDDVAGLAGAMVRFVLSAVSPTGA
jgi:AcrR family transcriptional regulator